jgi:hypothetical protein
MEPVFSISRAFVSRDDVSARARFIAVVIAACGSHSTGVHKLMRYCECGKFQLMECIRELTKRGFVTGSPTDGWRVTEEVLGERNEHANSNEKEITTTGTTVLVPGAAANSGGRDSVQGQSDLRHAPAER